MEVVDLKKISIKKPLTKTVTSLEFLLVTISKNFELKIKQSAALLTNGSKYLAHVIAKGVKGDYEPIIAWYRELYTHTDHIVTLLRAGDTKQVFPFLMNSFKPGLVSKSNVVGLWSCRLLSKLGNEFQQYPKIKDIAWDWFISPSGGLHTCILSLKRHNDIKDNIVQIME